MVMGPTHAMSGAAAGLLLPSILPGMTATPAVSLSFAGVCAGAASQFEDGGTRVYAL